MMAILLGVVAGFLLVAAIIGAWAWQLTRRQARPSPRDVLIALAAQAAADDGGRGLLALLRVLDEADGVGPVKVEWLARRTAQDAAPGFLLKITWDGNEWRRAVPPAVLRAALEARLAAEPQLLGAHAQRLLGDLRAAEAS